MTYDRIINRAATSLSVPWHAFVAAFLYYTLLASLLFGGARVSGGAVTTAYTAPALAYLVTITARALNAASRAVIRPADVGCAEIR